MREAWKGHISSWLPGCCLDCLDLNSPAVPHCRLAGRRDKVELVHRPAVCAADCHVHSCDCVLFGPLPGVLAFPILRYHFLGAPLRCGALPVPAMNVFDCVGSIRAGDASVVSPASQAGTAWRRLRWERQQEVMVMSACAGAGRGEAGADSAAYAVLSSLRTPSGDSGLNSQHVPRSCAGTTTSKLTHVSLCLGFPLCNTRRTVTLTSLGCSEDKSVDSRKGLRPVFGTYCALSCWLLSLLLF